MATSTPFSFRTLIKSCPTMTKKEVYCPEGHGLLHYGLEGVPAYQCITCDYLVWPRKGEEE